MALLSENVPTFQYYPWTILKRDMGAVTSASGIVFEMLNDIADNLNFTYTVVTPPDNEFGVRKKGSNEYNGMMGQLIGRTLYDVRSVTQIGCVRLILILRPKSN